jgi:UDP-N-acetylmuramate dehydrogenase
MPDSSEWRSFRSQLTDLSVDGLSVSESEPLAPHTTLKIGGPARLLVRCASREAVAATVRAAAEARIPWLVLGLGANVLVPDAGLDAAVLMLVDELAAVSVDGTRLRAGGGAQLARVVRAALDAGLAGIECLGGIPSTIGGALAMNAGAYGQEILNVVEWAEVVENGGGVRRLERREIEGGYRWSVLGVGRVVTSAELALKAEAPAALKTRAQEARERRRGALPPEPSAGSVFRNPPGEFAGRLLELAGCKGMRCGGAEVSERHANVIVNPGGATAAGVRELAAGMAVRVRERFGVRLELELKILDRNGKAVADPEAALASKPPVW